MSITEITQIVLASVAVLQLIIDIYKAISIKKKNNRFPDQG